MKDLPFTLYDFFAYLASGFWLLLIIGVATHTPWYAAKDVSSVTLLAYITVAYISGHVIAHLSSGVFEAWIVRRILNRNINVLFDQSADWRARLFPGYYTPLPSETQQRLLARARNFGISEPGRALFYHAHTRVKSDAIAFGRMNTFLNLYGFARNIAMASLLGCVVLIATAMPRSHAMTPDWHRVHLTIGVFFIAVIMFYRYLKFYRHYSLEMYATYAEGT